MLFIGGFGVCLTIVPQRPISLSAAINAPLLDLNFCFQSQFALPPELMTPSRLLHMHTNTI